MSSDDQWRTRKKNSISLTTKERGKQQKYHLNNEVSGFVVIISNSVIDDGDDDYIVFFGHTFQHFNAMSVIQFLLHTKKK